MNRLLLLGVAGACMLCSCGNQNHTQDKEHGVAEHQHEGANDIILSPEMAKEAGVKVKKIYKGKFNEIIRATGEVVAAQGEEVVVVSNVSGIVSLGQNAVNGTKVNKGTELFSISSDRIENGSFSERARIDFESAKKEYERALKLVEDQIVSQKDFNAIRQRYETARLAYEALPISNKGKGVSVGSPMSGYVKNCMVNEGDYVPVGQPLATITNVGRLQLRADVSGRYMSTLDRVSSANFRTVYDGRIYKLDDMNGRLVAYGKTFGNATNYLPVTFEFNNIGNIIPGSYVDVYLLGKQKNNVFCLPESAITEEQGIYFVYLQVHDDCYLKKEVTLGGNNGEDVEILSGLNEGETVVVEGALQVKLASVAKSIPGHSHEH